MIFSYETVKYVSIRDSRLGLLRYGLVGAIIVYVTVFEMWAYGGYLASVPISGVIRFSLQQPTEQNCDPFDTNVPCRNAFTPVNELIYCQQSPNSTSYRGTVYPCEIYEAINAQIITETSLVVISRAKSTNQTLVCGDDLDVRSVTTCPHTYESSELTNENPNGASINLFYVAQSEAFTVLLDHAVTAAKICRDNIMSDNPTARANVYACSAPSSSFRGRLYSTNDDLCKEFDECHQSSYRGMTGSQRIATAPCFVQPNQTAKANLDYFSIDVLLRAAGVALDDCADGTTNDTMTNTNSTTNTTKCQTYRDLGLTILLNIEWNDFLPYHGMVEPYYHYRAHLVSRSYKAYVPFYHTYRQSRTLLSAHGIRIAVLINGEFHHFEWITFLITLTTALGLLAVSTTVADSLMLYILPEKEQYAKAKYEAVNEIVALMPNTTMIPNMVNDDFNGNDENESSRSDIAPLETTFSLSDPLLCNNDTTSP
jgi:hypothetical protein